MGVGKYACFMQMYVYIYYWKSVNNTKQLDYDLPQTACDYHKVGMSVKGRLVGTHRTHFHSHISRSDVKGPLWKWPCQFFLAKFVC